MTSLKTPFSSNLGQNPSKEVLSVSWGSWGWGGDKVPQAARVSLVECPPTPDGLWSVQSWLHCRVQAVGVRIGAQLNVQAVLGHHPSAWPSQWHSQLRTDSISGSLSRASAAWRDSLICGTRGSEGKRQQRGHRGHNKRPVSHK